MSSYTVPLLFLGSCVLGYKYYSLRQAENILAQQNTQKYKVNKLDTYIHTARTRLYESSIQNATLEEIMEACNRDITPNYPILRQKVENTLEDYLSKDEITEDTLLISTIECSFLLEIESNIKPDKQNSILQLEILE